MTLIILYLTAAALPCVFAPGRGRRWWVWLALGLMFGPLLSWAVVFMAPVLHCPQCWGKVNERAYRCSHCRSILFWNAGPLADVGPATDDHAARL